MCSRRLQDTSKNSKNLNMFKNCSCVHLFSKPKSSIFMLQVLRTCSNAFDKICLLQKTVCLDVFKLFLQNKTNPNTSTCHSFFIFFIFNLFNCSHCFRKLSNFVQFPCCCVLQRTRATSVQVARSLHNNTSFCMTRTHRQTGNVPRPKHSQMLRAKS